MRNKIEKNPVRESLFKRVFGRLAKEEDGFAMEYVIIVLLVAAGVIAVVMVFSDTLRGMFGKTIEIVTESTVAGVKAVGEKLNEWRQLMKDNEDGAINAGRMVGTGETENGGSTPSVPEN